MSVTGRNTPDDREEALLDDFEALDAAEAAEAEALEKAEALEEQQAAQGVATEEILDPVALLEIEVADLKDKLLRNMAEMENMRRRAEREKAEATLYAATNFARDVLPVGDNLARALETIDDEARANASDAVKNLLEGVELTQRELLNTLQKHNITIIEPMGEKFDPNKHQAMFEVPDPEAVNGTVVQVVQAGYSIGDRVLRPAMVGVAKSDKKAS
ncbi:Heat shock protein GrpE [hydrothermal vent metagenome]|uniref:Heat shock protein GrpE n=1 Tax=hydrothermal vent metagenome TaxID=652676 RepID=A0A3B0R1H4_9ZZZZ